MDSDNFQVAMVPEWLEEADKSKNITQYVRVVYGKESFVWKTNDQGLEYRETVTEDIPAEKCDSEDFSRLGNDLFQAYDLGNGLCASKSASSFPLTGQWPSEYPKFYKA